MGDLDDSVDGVTAGAWAVLGVPGLVSVCADCAAVVPCGAGALVCGDSRPAKIVITRGPNRARGPNRKRPVHGIGFSKHPSQSWLDADSSSGGSLRAKSASHCP